MDQLYMTSQVSNITRKTRSFLTLVDMFSKIKQKSVKTEKKHIKLRLFYCQLSTFSKIITINNNFVGHKNCVYTYESVQILRFDLLYKNLFDKIIYSTVLRMPLYL